MKKIQAVVDESIENMVAEPSHNEEKIIDLSGLNFELLEQYFLKTKIKTRLFNRSKTRLKSN
jgi:type I restriction enzyme, R subunit